MLTRVNISHEEVLNDLTENLFPSFVSLQLIDFSFTFFGVQTESVFNLKNET